MWQVKRKQDKNVDFVALSEQKREAGRRLPEAMDKPLQAGTVNLLFRQGEKTGLFTVIRDDTCAYLIN